MANKKDSVIFYQGQVNICKKHLTTEQFGRLMAALFDLDAGLDPDVDDDIALAFEFMSLQQKIDREKYEKICEKNRENGKKGGAPKGNKNASKQPKQANGFQNNPNDNDNDNDKTMIKECKNNVNEQIDDSVIFYGRFENVELTSKEYYTLKQEYERTTELINKVSLWLRTHDAEDHFALCIKFADNDKWPKRKTIEPTPEIVVEDPLDPEEQEKKVKEMRARLNGIFA